MFLSLFSVFLAQFSGPGEEKLKHAAATFCSNQPFALEMIKSRQKKDSRFHTFVQDAERSRDSKRAGYGVLTEQARDKNLLLSYSPAHRIILHIHPAGLFGRSSQLKSGLCRKLSEFV